MNIATIACPISEMTLTYTVSNELVKDTQELKWLKNTSNIKIPLIDDDLSFDI